MSHTPHTPNPENALDADFPLSPAQLERVLAAINAADIAYDDPTPTNVARCEALAARCDDVTFRAVVGNDAV